MPKEIYAVDPLLTAYAWEYRNPQMVGTAILPYAPVVEESGRVPKWGNDSFRDFKTARAIGGDSNLIPHEQPDEIAFVLEENEIGEPVDYRIKRVQGLKAEQRAITRTQNIIARKLERKISTLLLNTASYASGNSITLSGSSQWSDSESEPIKTVNTGRKAIQSQIGIDPTAMLIGSDAYDALQSNPSLMERFKYTKPGLIKIEELKEVFQINNIVVGKGVYKDDSGIMQYMWGDAVVMAYVPEQIPANAPTNGNRQATGDMGEPAFGYTFQLEGHPFVYPYEKDNKKGTVYLTTDNFAPIILGNTAGYLILDTVA